MNSQVWPTFFRRLLCWLAPSYLAVELKNQLKWGFKAPDSRKKEQHLIRYVNFDDSLITRSSFTSSSTAKIHSGPFSNLGFLWPTQTWLQESYAQNQTAMILALQSYEDNKLGLIRFAPLSLVVLTKPSSNEYFLHITKPSEWISWNRAANQNVNVPTWLFIGLLFPDWRIFHGPNLPQKKKTSTRHQPLFLEKRGGFYQHVAWRWCCFGRNVVWKA